MIVGGAVAPRTAPTRTYTSRNGATCVVDGCEDPVKARRLCNRHYCRVLRHGSTDALKPQTPHEQVIEEVILLLMGRASLEEAGKVIGIKPDSVERTLERAGRHDIARRLRANNPPSRRWEGHRYAHH